MSYDYDGLMDRIRHLELQVSEAARLFKDLRENSTHPRHEQWRRECDRWLALNRPSQGAGE